MLRVIGLLIIALLFQGLALGESTHYPIKKSPGIPLSPLLWNGPSPLNTSETWIAQIFHTSERALPPISTPQAHNSVSEIKIETQNRKDLAHKVLRERMDNFAKAEIIERLNSYLIKSGKFNSTAITNLQDKMEKIKDIELFSSGEKTHSLSKKTSYTVKMGFDFRNSHSKLEYVEKDLELGLYHSRTLSTLTGRESFTQNLSLRLNKKWEERNLKASFDLPLTMPYYTASLSQDLSTSVSSSISAQAPLRGTNLARKFEIRIAFLF